MNYMGKPCPVCARTFRDEDDIVVCPKCGAPYHRECYEEKGACLFKELHKNHQSWQDIQPEEPKKSENDETADEVSICRRCGAHNPLDAIVCKECGSFLSREINPPAGSQSSNSSTPKDGPSVGNTSPFTIFLDPMGGVAQEEDFDGVSGAELAKYVKNNTTYYLPVFMRHKTTGRNRFNFCAFLFTGGWYLYRKQYVKGALLSLLYILVELGALFISMQFSSPLINEANRFYEGAQYVNINDYISWALSQKSFGDLILMFLPTLLSLLYLIVRIICGLRGNKSYYRHAVKKIKTIKENPDTTASDALKEISEKGGTNNAIAWVCLICYLIIYFAPLFIK